MIEDLLEKSISDKFKFVINEDSKSIDYFPQEWAKLTRKELNKLPKNLIKKLLDRLDRHKVKGEWTEPMKMFSIFSGESSMDNEGNVYFTHHFFKDDVMLEADIYIARKK